jgi:hypothetical protein
VRYLSNRNGRHSLDAEKAHLSHGALILGQPSYRLGQRESRGNKPNALGGVRHAADLEVGRECP